MPENLESIYQTSKSFVCISSLMFANIYSKASTQKRQRSKSNRVHIILSSTPTYCPVVSGATVLPSLWSRQQILDGLQTFMILRWSLLMTVMPWGWHYNCWKDQSMDAKPGHHCKIFVWSCPTSHVRHDGLGSFGQRFCNDVQISDVISAPERQIKRGIKTDAGIWTVCELWPQ